MTSCADVAINSLILNVTALLYFVVKFERQTKERSFGQRFTLMRVGMHTNNDACISCRGIDVGNIMQLVKGTSSRQPMITIILLCIKLSWPQLSPRSKGHPSYFLFSLLVCTFHLNQAPLKLQV